MKKGFDYSQEQYVIIKGGSTFDVATGERVFNVGSTASGIFKFTDQNSLCMHSDSAFMAFAGDTPTKVLDGLGYNNTASCAEDVILAADSRIRLYPGQQNGWDPGTYVEIDPAGNLSANKVYGAVLTDYAELFEKHEDDEIEPGDIVMLDRDSDAERYIKTTSDCSPLAVGVCSDEYAYLIGGEKPEDGVDFYEHNKKKFTPIGISGRVRPKITGSIKKGDLIVSSSLPGVGRKYVKGDDDPLAIIGMATESKDTQEISRVRMVIRN